MNNLHYYQNKKDTTLTKIILIYFEVIINLN